MLLVNYRCFKFMLKNILVTFTQEGSKKNELLNIVIEKIFI